MTEARNACGVWPRRSCARGGMSRITLSSSTSMIVSADGIATSTASYVSSASKHSVMIRALTSGRTASWNSTLRRPVADDVERSQRGAVAGLGTLEDVR